jgi:hypothetical protein
MAKVMERGCEPIGELVRRRSATMRHENTALRLEEDSRLFFRAGDGDIAAFDKLYRKYLPAVPDYLALFCGRHKLLKDAALEIYLRIWQNRKPFRAAHVQDLSIWSLKEHRVRRVEAIGQGPDC